MNFSICFAYSDTVISGETYSFQAGSLEDEDFDSSDYQFFWMASDGTPDSSWDRTFHWTAPVVSEPKIVNITLYVTRSDCGCTGKDQAELVVHPKSGSISLEKTHAIENEDVQVGDVVDYRITITNTGLANITSLQLIDDYPEEVMRPLDADRAWDEDNSSALSWNNLLDFPLDPGRSVSVNVQFEVTAASDQTAVNLAKAIGTMEGGGAELVAETADEIVVPVSSNCTSIGPASACAGIPVAFSAPEGLEGYAWTALNASGESVGGFDATSNAMTNWTPSTAGAFLISYGDASCNYQITVDDCQSQEGLIALEKTLQSGQDDVQVGDTINYSIAITNIGQTSIISLPLIDDYPEEIMRPLNADRPWDDDNLSVLAWDNLLVSPLLPGQSIRVNIAFRAVEESDLSVTNIARVIGATDENGAEIDSQTVDCLIGSISAINCPPVGPAVGCVGIPVTLSAPAGLDSYSWTAVDANGQSVGGFNATGMATVVWTPPSTGTFTISYNHMICIQKIVVIQCRISRGEISLAKTLQSETDSIIEGDTINFSINITNTGQASIVSLPLIDDYPEQFMRPLGSDRSWDDDNLSALVWNNLLVSPLEPGQSVRVFIDFQAIAASSTSLTNTARVTGAMDENDRELEPETADCQIPAISSINCPSIGPESGCVGVPVTFSASEWRDGYQWMALDSSGRSVGGFDDTGIATAIWMPPDSGEFAISYNAMVCGQRITINHCQVSSQPVSIGQIRLEKTLASSRGGINAGDIIRFNITIANIGQNEIFSLPLVDDYPEDFIKPLHSDRPWDDDNLSVLAWDNLLVSPLEPGQSVRVFIDFQAIAASEMTLTNTARVVGARDENESTLLPQAADCTIPGIGPATEPRLHISKTAEKGICSPEDTIKYTIIFGNDFDLDATDVTVHDVLPDVEYLNSTPQPDHISGNTLIWKIGTLKSRENGSIELSVRIKEKPDMRFEESQSVSGTGYAYSRKRLSTCTEDHSLANYVNITAFSGREFASSTATILIQDAKGTEVQTTSHGSGTLQEEQNTLLLTENKTIQISTSLSERHIPTSFALPAGRSIQYSSRWSEAQTAQNLQTGASIEERYSHATRIDRNSSLLLDRNGSTLKAETSFEGAGHLAMVKLPSNDTSQHQHAPTYESREDYLGSFRVSTEFDEYGKNAVSSRSASGTGAVSSDRRMAKSQRSYDSGTGTYQSEDQYQTQTSFMAREINASYVRDEFAYSRDTNISQSNRWKAGMWSRSGVSSPSGGSAPASFISEEISDADYLDCSTVAAGLNKMNSSAEFSGTSRFQVVKTGSDKAEDVAFYEEYRGRYAATRSVEIGGVARFDQPHLSVSKEGRMESAGGTLVDYVISVSNDGNKALGPVHVWDLFPPHTEYVYSSLRPSELNSSNAGWEFASLGIGETSIIELRLNMTEYSDSLVNRVQARAGYEDEWITAGNFSVIELNWLGCSQMNVYAAKTARIDSVDPTLVHYRIMLKNQEAHIVAASISDQLPEGMMFQNSSLPPADSISGAILWNIVDLQPGETRCIEYEAKALHSGAFVNQAHIEVHSLDGSDSGALDVESCVEVGGPGKSSTSGWQPPQCFGLNCTQQDFGEEWMPCYTCGAVEPEPVGIGCSCSSAGGSDSDIP